MLQDIKLTGCTILNSPFLPEPLFQEYHLFYVFDGNGLLTADSTTYPCSKDTLYLFSQLEVAFCRPANRSTLTILRVSFSCSSSSLATELNKLPVSLLTNPFHRSLFLEIFHEYSAKRAFYEDLCCLYLEQFLIPLVASDCRKHTRAFTFPRLSEKPDAPLVPVCSYIEEHLNDSITIDSLCDIVHLSPRQLGSAFYKNFHLSTSGYIRSRRLEKAKELLAFSDCTVTQIADMTGFTSVHYFSSFFKSKLGLSPQKYRSVLSNEES